LCMATWIHCRASPEALITLTSACYGLGGQFSGSSNSQGVSKAQSGPFPCAAFSVPLHGTRGRLRALGNLQFQRGLLRNLLTSVCGVCRCAQCLLGVFQLLSCRLN